MAIEGFVRTSTLFFWNCHFSWNGMTIDIRIDTICTGVITSCPRSTNLFKKLMTALERKHHRYLCKAGWWLDTLSLLLNCQPAHNYELIRNSCWVDSAY
jgi:hypothetical protein